MSFKNSKRHKTKAKRKRERGFHKANITTILIANF